MKIALTVFALVLVLQLSAQLPKVFILDANHLVQIKKKIQEKDKNTLRLVDSLKKRADNLLKMKPVSVMDKAFTAVSGNKHDYMSQAPYFWYDSNKTNGLPYIRRDGQHNPEIKKNHRPRLFRQT